MSKTIPVLPQEEIDEIVKNLNIEVKMGDPRSPYAGQMLSIEDEQRLSPDGTPIVRGEPWSKTGTGLYLSVGVTMGYPKADRKIIGGSVFPVSLALSSHGLKMFVVTTKGLPTFSVAYIGAAIELPSDLGQDDLKRQYLVEWLKETAQESLQNAGCDLAACRPAYEEMALSVAFASEKAILAAKL